MELIMLYVCRMYADAFLFSRWVNPQQPLAEPCFPMHTENFVVDLISFFDFRVLLQKIFKYLPIPSGSNINPLIWMQSHHAWTSTPATTTGLC